VREYTESRSVMAWQILDNVFRKDKEHAPFQVMGTGGVFLDATHAWMDDQKPKVGDYMIDNGKDVFNPSSFRKIPRKEFESRFKIKEGS